jgi:H/ACA ribonucleoprotein complex non-core subunit NAF1
LSPSEHPVHKQPLYYVPEFASFVFTQALRGMKGSDASNLYDEEVNDEVRFSTTLPMANKIRKENSQMMKLRLPTREISSGREAKIRVGEQPGLAASVRPRGATDLHLWATLKAYITPRFLVQICRPT